jgi:hypothetical protein
VGNYIFGALSFNIYCVRIRGRKAMSELLEEIFSAYQNPFDNQ